jgi:hypothetical protein
VSSTDFLILTVAQVERLGKLVTKVPRVTQRAVVDVLAQELVSVAAARAGNACWH